MNSFIIVQVIVCLSIHLALVYTATVEPSIFKTIQETGSASIFVSFKNSNLDEIRDVAITQEFSSRADRINTLREGLETLANISQAPLITMLKQNILLEANEIQQFWISNQVYIKRADQNVLNQLLARDDISEITEEMIHYIENPARVSSNITILQQSDYQWGVAAIQAPKVWQRGNRGAGVVIATIDTGVRGTHEALRNGFRSLHGWYDPIYGNSLPNDDSGHGTHVTGTIVGRTYGIGVAPEAQWISCRGCGNDGTCLSSHLLKCLQWVICPTDSQGYNPRCDLAPRLVSNSWGSNSDSSFYNDAIKNILAGDITVIFSAGNNGQQGCSTVGSPSTHPEAISVGSLDMDNRVSSFSSRGPSPQFRSIQPDVAAPGSGIWSAVPAHDVSYGLKSGTSMAAPHVAGLVALLYSENPHLTVTQIRRLVVNGAEPVISTGEFCEGIRDNVYPNNHVGHGCVNADLSITAVTASSLTLAVLGLKYFLTLSLGFFYFSKSVLVY